MYSLSYITKCHIVADWRKIPHVINQIKKTELQQYWRNAGKRDNRITITNDDDDDDDDDYDDDDNNNSFSPRPWNQRPIDFFHIFKPV